MVSRARPTALQWVLLCALTLAVLGMHHLSGTGSHGAGSHDAEPGQHAAITVDTEAMAADCCENHQPVVGRIGHGLDGAHDMLHLCLAVLGAAAALTLAWLLRRRGPVASALARGAVSARRGDRGPPPPRRAPDRLSSLCVLRL